VQDYIIFGAGQTGRLALQYLGYNRVRCFVDNSENKSLFEGKEVLTFKQLSEISENDYILVIASKKYQDEMELQIKNLGIKKYFVFEESEPWDASGYLPNYWLNRKNETIPYSYVLAQYPIRRYRNIVILGMNKGLPYLISEISMISDYSNIRGIISLADTEKEYSYMGIGVYKNTDILETADCIVVNERRCNNPYVEVLDEQDADIVDIYDVDKFIPNYRHDELKKFKNLYKGKRIWLIGNGPSMNIDDLNVLHKNNEICIAFNKIYRIFDKTEWRPDFIGMTDMDVIVQVQDEVYEYGIPLIISDRYNEMLKFDERYKAENFVHMISEEFYPNMARFSDDIVKGVFLGASSVYDIGLQFAAYMGASEVYLIGVDNSMQGHVTDECNHFIKDYYRPEEKELYKNRKSTFDETVKSYEAAEKYSRIHGFRIFNATRGGALEVFERVNFDNLF
jgi:hypothetical protein